MSNVFKKAKQLRKQHPNKSWQQLVQLASKKTTAKKTAKKVGAYKVIEKGENKNTRPSKVVQVVRNSSGTFKGTKKIGAVTVGSIKKHYESKLQTALWKHEKATTVKATKAAAAEIKKLRAMLKKI